MSACLSPLHRPVQPPGTGRAQAAYRYPEAPGNAHRKLREKKCPLGVLRFPCPAGQRNSTKHFLLVKNRPASGTRSPLRGPERDISLKSLYLE